MKNFVDFMIGSVLYWFIGFGIMYGTGNGFFGEIHIFDYTFVGDSNVDIRTAKNGKMASCGVLWGFRTREELEAEHADFLVESPAALAGIIVN